MATWTTISNAAVAVGGIPSSATVQAFRDNPVAIAESASGAPVVASAWHPYDKVTVGDGKTGIIYDFAVDGALATIVTPDFEDGYEYRLIGRGLSHNDASNRSFRIELLGATSGVYVFFFRSSNADAATLFDIDAEICTPRLSLSRHIGRFIASRGVASLTTGGVASMNTTEKASKARFSLSAGSYDAGKIWMLRRREYLTLD